MDRPATLALTGLATLALGTAGASADVTNLVENGSFEATPFSQSWTLFDSIPGWTPSGGVKIELQRDVRGWQPKDGDYYAELDSHGPGDAPLGIYQDIATEAGTGYDLSLWFSPRPGVAENTLNILWDGDLVGTYDADGRGKSNTDWQRIDLTLEASDDLTRLEFRLGDQRNTLGTFIDDIRLTQVVPTPGSAALLGLGGMCVLRRRRRA